MTTRTAYRLALRASILAVVVLVASSVVWAAVALIREGYWYVVAGVAWFIGAIDLAMKEIERGAE
jgi:hypothetical protein